MSQIIGKISQIIGPVVDVTFDNQGAEISDSYDASTSSAFPKK
jgi:F0F1-type ATP synthase beta subunit